METFQLTVLLIAVIILIITLVFIGLALRKAKNAQQWPPMIPECPDYWSLQRGTNGAPICSNDHNLGTCKEKTKDFNISTFSGSQGLCNKYKWATSCGIAWDGITYGVKNPCFQS